MKTSEKDNKLGSLLKNYESPQSPWDLEDRIMQKIKTLEKQQANKKHYLQYAWMFFGIGLISGSLITSFWFSPTEFIFNIPIERLIFPIQIGVVFFLLLFFNELIKITFKQKP